ncbi:hypothetical protein Vi05172_g12659 [Venturia inaequalis]|nr:hypothetical protein Vi05172_g12659 [Venturia inaequalis]
MINVLADVTSYAVYKISSVLLVEILFRSRETPHDHDDGDSGICNFDCYTLGKHRGLPGLAR